MGLAGLLALGLGRDPNLTHVTFTADTTSTFANPERGWSGYGVIGWDNSGVRTTSTKLMQQPSGPLPGQSAPADWTVIRSYVRLDNFISTATLPAAMLTDLDTWFDEIRALGIKIIPRFTYAFDGIGNPDATKARMLEHIAQVGPVLAANADVIAALDCGFIGAWGEMHNSTNGMNLGGGEADRLIIIGAILDVLPASRSMTVRFSADMRNLGSSALLTRDTAHDGSDLSRVGLYNDFTVGDYYDSTTYGFWTNKSVEEDRAFVAAQTRFVPAYGESGNDTAALQSYGPIAMRDMERNHYSCHSGTWNPTFLNKWYAQAYGSTTYYEEIGRRLGYRLELTDLYHSPSIEADGPFVAEVKLINRGFAAPFNERPAYFVLTQGSWSHRMEANGDIRFALPGRPFKLWGSWSLPSDLPSGSVDLHLELPDMAETLIDDPRYSILCANANMRDTTTGLNLLTRGIAGSALVAVPHNSTVSINGVTFTAQSTAGTPYSIRRDAARDTTWFTRPPGQTRSELRAPRMAIGATEHWTWDFVVEVEGDGAWNAIGQVHGLNDVNGRSAPFALFLELDQLIARHRSTDVGGVVQSAVSAAIGALVIGQRYSCDLTFKQHATDGICIFKMGLYGQALTTYFNVTTGRFGFPDEESGQPADNGPYYKHGDYGDTANTIPMRIHYYNVTRH